MRPKAVRLRKREEFMKRNIGKRKWANESSQPSTLSTETKQRKKTARKGI